jgi:hypothetical protein
MIQAVHGKPDREGDCGPAQKPILVFPWMLDLIGHQDHRPLECG